MDKTPADIIVNGTRSGLLPSPPSTVSSVTTPARPISPPTPSPQRQRTNKKKRPHPTSPPQQGAVLAPRPAQDLLVERAYLVGSLAAQGARAAELIRRLSVAEQVAAEGEGGRRRLRKRIALLQGKIAAVAEQEKAVIVRLGELYVEMQSRERWARVRAEAAMRECYFPVMPPGHPACGAPVPVAEEPAVEGLSISTGLNPLSPEFVPSWARGGNPWPIPDVPVPGEQ